MIATLLKDAGLKEEAVEIYSALLEKGAQTAGELLKAVPTMKRPTLYKELRGLCAAGLVSEGQRGGKILFAPLSPETLLVAAEERKREAEAALARTSAALEALRIKYLTSFQKPTIRYYEGEEGLKELHERFIRDEHEVYLIRASGDRPYKKMYGKWWPHYLRRRAETGVVTHALTTTHPFAVQNAVNDEVNGVQRSWIRPEDYTVPIDIKVNDTTMAVVSYGKEVFGLTVENMEIAKGLKELFRLAEIGAKTIGARPAGPSGGGETSDSATPDDPKTAGGSGISAAEASTDKRAASGVAQKRQRTKK